jgi:hypothetical protein
MFGSRSVLVAAVALTLGASAAFAQATIDPARQKFLNCTGSLELVDNQQVYYWEYDDPTNFNITYKYDPTYCDKDIPVNNIRLYDNIGGGIYTCEKKQFVAGQNRLRSTCTTNYRYVIIPHVPTSVANSAVDRWQ